MITFLAALAVVLVGLLSIAYFFARSSLSPALGVTRVCERMSQDFHNVALQLSGLKCLVELTNPANPQNELSESQTDLMLTVLLDLLKAHYKKEAGSEEIIQNAITRLYFLSQRDEIREKLKSETNTALFVDMTRALQDRQDIEGVRKTLILLSISSSATAFVGCGGIELMIGLLQSDLADKDLTVWCFSILMEACAAGGKEEKIRFAAAGGFSVAAGSMARFESDLSVCRCGVMLTALVLLRVASNWTIARKCGMDEAIAHAVKTFPEDPEIVEHGRAILDVWSNCPEESIEKFLTHLWESPGPLVKAKPSQDAEAPVEEDDEFGAN